MKNYIKPEVKVYEVRIESLLSGSEGGQIKGGLAPKRDYSLFDEENDDGQTGSGGLWDDEDFED
uniref:toxin PIN n=1 Tax=Prevotella sp. TaxID=59823 RepID=UPI004025ECCC